MAKFSVDPGEVLRTYKVVAVVGASKNPEKDANTVPVYLREHGYEVVPVNPTATLIDGAVCYPSLAEIPEELARRVDIVDVFRPSEEFPDVARQVVAMKERSGRPFVFWGQLGLESDDAKEVLSQADIGYVMDKCMRTEHQQLILG